MNKSLWLCKLLMAMWSFMLNKWNEALMTILKKVQSHFLAFAVSGGL